MLTTNNELLTELQQIKDLQVEIDHDLTLMTSIRLKATGDLLIVRSLEALCQTVKTLTKYSISYRPLGLGANTIIPELAKIPYLKLDLFFDPQYLTELRGEYTLPASITLNNLTNCASRLGLKGWEIFTGIPATLGGALCMNAGTNLGEIGSLAKNFRLVTKEGEIKTIIPNEKTFKYRHNNILNAGDIIFEVTLLHHGHDPKVTEIIRAYLKKRSLSQPLTKHTCGCVFKNRKTSPACLAGQSLDIIGFKGFTYKNIRVSPIHGNFFEHGGGATKTDFINMTEIINDELNLQLGIRLEFEVRD